MERKALKGPGSWGRPWRIFEKALAVLGEGSGGSEKGLWRGLEEAVRSMSKGGGCTDSGRTNIL